GARFEIPEERAEIPLLGGEEPLDVAEALDGRGAIGVHEPAGDFELEPGPGQGLEKPIVEIAGEADTRFDRGRRPKPLEEAKPFQAHGQLTRDGLPEDQVVRGGRSDVENEEPAMNRLATKRQPHDGADAEPGAEIRMERDSAPPARLTLG